MLPRTSLLYFARSLTRWTPSAVPQARRTTLGASAASLASPFSCSCTLQDTPNKPGKSGDKGPQKNYRKKVIKKQKKEHGVEVGADLSALLEEMKRMESQPQSQPVPAGHIASLMKGKDGSRGGNRPAKNRQRTDDLHPEETVVHQSNRANVRHRQGQPGKVVHPMDGHLPKLRGKGMSSPVNFTDPSSGRRLGFFDRPKRGSKVMPRATPTLAEQDDLKGLQELFLLKPTTHYEEQMTDSMSTAVHYPRSFPIDNDDYFKDHEEASTGFEDHVLLDHLLEGFPKKGPVRHFMELVVTGLSKNPHYSASEKRQCVEWYREYFNDFTSKELQSI